MDLVLNRRVNGTREIGRGFAAPSADEVKVLAEATLALVLFSDVSGVGLHQLRGDLRPCLRLLGIGLPLSIGLGTLLAFILTSPPGTAAPAEVPERRLIRRTPAANRPRE